MTMLNIFYYEIELHSVDNGHNYCSFLSHSEEITWKCDYVLCKKADAANSWKAFVVFDHLKLKQLHILENDIVEEEFK